MESLYTIYFNSENEVIPLGFCNGYTHAEEIFENVTTKSFLKKHFSLTGVTSVTTKICRYSENLSTAARAKDTLKADISFPKGVVFVKKMHEATIYEKDFSGVKYLGRIAVLAQSFDSTKISALEVSLKRAETLLVQQNTIIQNLVSEIERLERQTVGNPIDNTFKRAFGHFHVPTTSDFVQDQEAFVIPRAPKPPTPFQAIKASQKPLIDELKEKFASREKLLHVAPKTIHTVEKEANAMNRLLEEIEKMGIFF